MIEIDLGVRRRNRARGGVNNDMVGVTVDRELPREEEDEEEGEEGVVNDEEEEVDSSQEEGEYQVDEVDGERIVSADSLEGLAEERLAAPPWQAMPPNLLDARLGGDEALGEGEEGGEPNDYRVPPPEGGRPPPPQVPFPQTLPWVQPIYKYSGGESGHENQHSGSRSSSCRAESWPRSSGEGRISHHRW